MTIIVTVVLSAIKSALGLVGTSFWFIPTFLVALAYYHYDLFDPENKPINVRSLHEEYDFIVVGAGSAGAVVANRLTEVPDWTTLLLEAGGHETELTDVPVMSIYLHKSRIDWGYRTQPSTTACQAMIGKRCCWPRGKVLGGSSVLNTMMYVRGNRRDFDNWESLGNPGWGYDDVLPYFLKSQDQRNPYLQNNKYHATGGYLTVQEAPWHTPLGPAFVQAGEEMGYDNRDINGDKQTGFMILQYTMRRGYRCSTSKAFLRPVRLRSNLHVALWSQATKVFIDPETKRAYAVEFIRDGIRHTVRARREIILSAGAINTPQLLMLSGIGPREHLEELGIPVMQDLRVGDNLQDHIATGGITFRIDQPVSLVMSRVVNINAALRYAVLGDGPLTSNIGLEAVGFVSTKYANQSDDWPDMELMLTSSSTSSDGGTQVWKSHGITREFYDEVFKPIENQDVFGVYPMILRPQSRGYMRLRSRNPRQYPLLYHNYLTHPDDVKVMREGIKFSLALAETTVMKRFGARFHRIPVPGCKKIPFGTDEYWECVVRQYTMTIYHQSGTCRMGPASDPTAVVNYELKVHGIAGLRVMDASIMPNITSGNTNAPVIMIGEKGADMVKHLWLQTLRK